MATGEAAMARDGTEAREGVNARLSLIDPADRMMLSSVQIALEHPFRDPVRVCGQLMTRSLARQIERQLLRLRVMERRTQTTA